MAGRGIGVRLPVARSNDEGFELVDNYRELATQNLRMLVLTVPGERMMDPEFGVGARHFLFEQMTSETKERFKSRLLTQQQRYLPYLVISEVQFLSTETNPEMPENRLDIRIFYYNKVLRSSDVLSLPITS
jgi:phage baseplate assembly protein W